MDVKNVVKKEDVFVKVEEKNVVKADPMCMYHDEAENTDKEFEIKRFLKIQELLCNLNDSNFKETQSELINIIESDEDYDELALMVINVSNSRPKLIEVFAKLCYNLYLELPFSEYFVQSLLKNGRSMLIRYLYVSGVFTLDMIKERMKTYTDLSFYFLPEIGTSFCFKQKENYRYIEIKKHIEKYKKNNWNLYHQILQYGYLIGSPCYAIKYDDVELLDKLYKEKKFNLHDPVIVGLYEGYGGKMDYLSCAAYYGSVKSFDYLLKIPMLPDKSICQYAIHGGSLEIINKLCSIGVDFSYSLSDAVTYHRNDIFDFLLKKKAVKSLLHKNVIGHYNIKAFLFMIKNSPCNKTEMLRYAALRGSLSICSYLLKDGADINSFNKSGRTLMHIAAASNRLSMIKFLMRKHANFDLRDKNGNNPFHIAAICGFKDICKEFLKYNIDVDIKNDNGCTPLYLAAENGMISCCKMLIDNGAKVNEVNDAHQTPLLVATKGGHNHVCKYLLEKGANVNIPNNDKFYPLHYAANNYGLLDLYIKNNAHVNVAATNGAIPIWWCTNQNCKRLLISHGSDLHPSEKEEKCNDFTLMQNRKPKPIVIDDSSSD